MEDNLIHRMDCWLRDNRPAYYATLQPPADDIDLDQFENRFSIKLPTEFRSLYKWRNGQDLLANNFDVLVGNQSLMPLENIADTKEMLDGMIGFDFEDPKWWRRGWIPFLANGGGDHLCLDIAAEDGGQPGQLISFWHDWDQRSVEFPNITGWLTKLVESMESGLIELD